MPGGVVGRALAIALWEELADAGGDAVAVVVVTLVRLALVIELGGDVVFAPVVASANVSSVPVQPLIQVHTHASAAHPIGC